MLDHPRALHTIGNALRRTRVLPAVISLIATVLLCQSPPPPPPPPPRVETETTRLTIDEPVRPKPENRHTLEAHRKLRQRIRLELIPNLRSYKALSNNVVASLHFLDDVQDIARKLDRFRRGKLTKALEHSIPGFRWLTTGWDSLTELIDRMEAIRRAMKRLKRTSEDLLKAAERYTKSPTNERLQSLVDGYEDAKKVFEDAQATFGSVDRFLGKVRGGLDKTAAVLDRLSTSFIGRYLENLGQRVRGLRAQIAVLRAILTIGGNAIDRDRKGIANLVGVYREAQAHDAYDSATTLADADQPGSALAAFRDLATRWPDTEWAHRSDRRIVELITYVDQLEQDMKSARTEIAALNGELAKKPKVVIRTVERQKIVPLKPEPAYSWSLAAGAAAGIALLGLGAVLVRRRRSGA